MLKEMELKKRIQKQQLKKLISKALCLQKEEKLKTYLPWSKRKTFFIKTFVKAEALSLALEQYYNHNLI